MVLDDTGLSHRDCSVLLIVHTVSLVLEHPGYFCMRGLGTMVLNDTGLSHRDCSVL